MLGHLEKLLSLAINVRPGDVILVRGSTWIDRTIQGITRSRYSHVAGIIKQNEIIDLLPFSKAGYRNLWLYAGQADVFTCDTLTEEQRKKIVNNVIGKVGTSYDYLLLIWQVSRYLLNWEWSYENTKHSLCSTLWADAYRKVGVELCPDVAYPSPGDLADSRLLRQVWSY